MNVEYILRENFKEKWELLKSYLNLGSFLLVNFNLFICAFIFAITIYFKQPDGADFSQEELILFLIVFVTVVSVLYILIRVMLVIRKWLGMLEVQISPLGIKFTENGKSFVIGRHDLKRIVIVEETRLSFLYGKSGLGIGHKSVSLPFKTSRRLEDFLAAIQIEYGDLPVLKQTNSIKNLLKR